MITGPAVLAVNRMELTIFDVIKKPHMPTCICGFLARPEGLEPPALRTGI